MKPITIKFQAYIPNSLGKPLLSYFENNPIFRRDLLVNYDEFKRKLMQKDGKGYTWIPEPGSFVSNYFFATDDSDFHTQHSRHNSRLSIEAVFDINKIGNYHSADAIFKHGSHKGALSGHQHSGLSHRVKAYFVPLPEAVDRFGVLVKNNKYKGICDDDIRSQRSAESPLKTSISNTKSRIGANVLDEKDTTIVKVSASAGYPFTEPMSPNIDFLLTFGIYKDLRNKRVNITIKGLHDKFPAYELLIGNKVVYAYNPSEHGHFGPNPLNLNSQVNFTSKEVIKLEDWQMRELEKKETFKF